MGVIAYKDKFYAGSIEDGWKPILDNIIPSDAEEIKVVAYSNGEVAQAVFDTYTFGSDWKWYIINGYYASASDNVRVITQFKQGAIGAKLFYVNGSAKTATFDFYYRKASSYIGLVDEREIIVVSKAINTTLPANGSVNFQFQDVVPSGYYPISAVYDVGSGGNDSVHPSAVMVNGSSMLIRFNQLFDTASGSRSIKGTMVITCVKKPT